MTSIMTSIFLGFSARTSTSSTANQDGARGRMTPFNPESESPVPQLADAQRVSNETSSGWELEWVRRVASGDRSAFERLYNGYQRRLFGYLYRMVGKADAAEELTNDVMLEVWKGAAGFRGDSDYVRAGGALHRAEIIEVLHDRIPESRHLLRARDQSDPR